MDAVEDWAHIIVREATASVVATASSTNSSGCQTQNNYDGRIGLRVSAIFVILVGSLGGAILPIYAKKNRGVRVPEWVFFVCKYFGSGVIIATAFIHLLAPANAALTNPCLTGVITQYSWVEGIVLMTIFALFFVELMAVRYSIFPHTHEHEHDQPAGSPGQDVPLGRKSSSDLSQGHGHAPGEDHMGHSREHVDSDSESRQGRAKEDYSAQMAAIFILEFGVIFHSFFIGLALAVAGEEFVTLYVVLVFHQTFEGLGLGSRLAVTPWPESSWWIPYAFAGGYGISTPIAIAIGLGLRNTYAPGSATALTINGIFDSVSAGILIYTGLVELMAHEFMFSDVMRKAKLSVVLSAYGVMCLGAGLMAVLGEWA